jgi:HD-like signal output (HDOD) protein
MLEAKIERKLESITDLPVVPTYIGKILRALDNTDIRAKKLAEYIEKDQALTIKILRAANSPWYGQKGKIATVDLAIIIMGLNTIKEIVIGMLVDKFFSKTPAYLFDINSFWNYSLFCGSTSRLLARKTNYKKAGEAFVAGLMHDIGILIIIQYFTYEFKEIKQLVESGKFDMIKAEELVLGNNHAEIGAWMAKKWNLPDQLINSVKYHHIPKKDLDVQLDQETISLTRIVSASEWFANFLGFRTWTSEQDKPKLFATGDDILDFIDDDILDLSSQIAIMKHEMMREFERASEFNPNPI